MKSGDDTAVYATTEPPWPEAGVSAERPVPEGKPTKI
jgi:hypothetical protein